MDIIILAVALYIWSFIAYWYWWLVYTFLFTDSMRKNVNDLGKAIFAAYLRMRGIPYRK